MASIKQMVEEIIFKNNLTQKEFALRYGFEESQVARWLAEKTQPRVGTYIKIKEVYDKLGNG